MAAVLNEAVVFKQKLIRHRDIKICIYKCTRRAREFSEGSGLSARLCERIPIFRYEK